MTDVLTSPVEGRKDFDPERPGTAPPDVSLTRRQLGLVIGGGALAAVAVGGVAVSTWPGGSASGGSDSGGSASGEVTRGLGTWTSFGTVAVLFAERRARGSADAAGHTGHGMSFERQDAAWTDEVTLEVAVHNGMGRPVLVSPGQLRLRLGPGGPTVTPFDPGRAPGPVQPGATERLRISYLAPSGTGLLSAEFTDPMLDDVLPLELPNVPHGPSAKEGAGR